MKHLILSLIAMPAFATGLPPTQHGTSVESVVEAHSSAITSSDSQSSAAQSQTANGGNAYASSGSSYSYSHGGDSTNTANGGTSQAVNNGNNASQSTEFNYPRQAPSVGQGSIAIAGCGAGGNAGGSNANGAAFLGIAFTPADCKLLLASAAYQALGMYDSACEMVNGISTVKARWKALGVNPPSCAIQPPAQTISAVAPPVEVNVTTADLSKVATKDDLAGYVSKEEGRRIFERSVAK